MTPDQFREILREELQPLEQRIDSLETRLTGAILILADHMPGSYPGQPSYVRTKIEEALHG